MTIIWHKHSRSAWASVARGDFSILSFSGMGDLVTPGGSPDAPKRRMGSRLYSDIIYYKWKHSQGRHYQTFAPSRIPTTRPCHPRNHPCAHRVRPSIHFARGLSIRTAELLCRLIDSLSERCEVRYPTSYGFNFMPIISARRKGRRREDDGGGENEYSRYTSRIAVSTLRKWNSLDLDARWNYE